MKNFVSEKEAQDFINSARNERERALRKIRLIRSRVEAKVLVAEAKDRLKRESKG